MTVPNTTPPVEYTLLDNGVHQFRFNEPTHGAIDVWMAKVEDIARAMPPTALVRYLVDLNGYSNLPVSYAFQRGQQMMRRVKDRPKTHIAILYPPGFTTNIAAAFIRLLRSHDDKVRMFPTDQRDQAIAWVLLDK
jgi:hypothetical protein